MSFPNQIPPEAPNGYTLPPEAGPPKGVLTGIDRFATRLADWVIQWRWWMIMATLALVIAAGSGGRFIEFSNNYRAFFGPDNPELVAFEQLQATYTKNDNILFVVQPKEGKLLTSAHAEAVERITDAAWKLPFARRVDSLTNFQHTWSEEDDLTVEDLLTDGATMSDEERARRLAIALAEPLLTGALIAPDARTTGVNVTLNYPQKSLTEVPQAAAAARALVAEIERDHPDLTVALTGISMLNNAFAEAGQKDIATLVPIMYGILLVVMGVILRSVVGTLGTLLVILFSMITAMGISGYLGIKLTPVSATAPTIILTLAIADSIHMLSTWLTLMRQGLSKTAAIKESIRINFMAITVTSLTTVVGFLALNFSDAPPFHDLGNITAVGIIAAWVYSLTFLPAVISLLPVRIKQAGPDSTVPQDWLDRWVDGVCAFAIRRARAILISFGSVTVILVALIPTLHLNDQWVEYFDYSIDFRSDAEFAIDHLTGLYPVEYSIEALGPQGISDPDYLTHLEKFTEWLRAQDEVKNVYSYSDIIKRLNKNLHGDDPDWYRVPEERELAAQYLLLYELSLAYGLDLNDRINIDKSATRLTATLDIPSTVELRAFMARSDEWKAANMPAHMQAQPTSASVMFANISERNINSMLVGNAIALALIAIVIAISLRSLPMGAFSLIPNAAPVMMTFGIWALLVGQVGMASAVVTATALGIVVDDTVHFLSKYLRGRREKGLDPEGAVRYAFSMVGRAITTTTVILCVGFGILALSAFKVNAEMGLLTALAIFLALIFDFLLLPALLLAGKKRHQPTNHAPFAPAE